MCPPQHPSQCKLWENKLWSTIGTNGFCTKPHDGCILGSLHLILSLFSLTPSLSLLFLLSPLSPALYVSVRKLERTWALSHPPIPSLDGYIICLLFLAMTLYSPWQDIKQTTFFPSPSFLFLSALSPSLLFPRCLQWFPFLHYPPEHSVNHDCRGNAWDFQKQTASVPVP